MLGLYGAEEFWDVRGWARLHTKRRHEAFRVA